MTEKSEGKTSCGHKPLYAKRLCRSCYAKRYRKDASTSRYFWHMFKVKCKWCKKDVKTNYGYHDVVLLQRYKRADRAISINKLYFCSRSCFKKWGFFNLKPWREIP